MLRMVERAAEIDAAQTKLARELRRVLPSQGVRGIGFPGGNTSHEIFSAGEGRLYYAYSPPRANTGALRHWNSFGVFRRDARMQSILVEINVPVAGSNGRVSGFFAVDEDTGDTYLMHDGGVGGGRKGIGRESFLRFVADPLFEVRGHNSSRTALKIANLADPGLAALIWRFAEKVGAYKEAAVAGALPPAPTGLAVGPFKSEHHGRKSGTRSGEFDYETYHGMVVDSLYAERSKLFGKDKVGRNQLIDLFVMDGATRSEVYEVKTSCDRTSLYTALGQLATHAPDERTIRTLVVPHGEAIPDDCADALRRLRVAVRRFALSGSGDGTSVYLVGN